MSLWSNALVALRRLGLAVQVEAWGSIIDRISTVDPNGRPLAALDVATLGAQTGSPSICILRSALQHVLLEGATGGDYRAVKPGRQCVGFEANESGCVAHFADGSREEGDLLIGADGIHSVVRAQLFGEEPLRLPGVFVWRGVARGAGGRLPLRRALAVMGRGMHAGFFHCGGDDLYWFLACNTGLSKRSATPGDKAEILALTASWPAVPRTIIEATDEAAILRNDVFDRPGREVWGSGRVTLLGDAAHATTPNLGQGACQAIEDAVVLAASLRDAATIEAGLRDYEARRRERANFVIAQSWRFGRIAQLANPLGAWLRDKLATTQFARRQTDALFTRLLCSAELPELS